MNVVTRGMRNAFRNPIRTVSIVVILGLSVGMALAMLIARQAVTQKISSVKSSVGNTVSVSPAGVRGFEGGGEALTAADIAKLTKLDHVKGVTQTLNDRLTEENSNLKSAVDAGSLGQRFSANNGTNYQQNGGPVMIRQQVKEDGSTGEVVRTFTPPVTVIGTTNPKNLSSTTGGGTFNLTDGQVFTGNSTKKEAVVGKSLAEKNNLKVGSTFTAYNAEIKVIGIFDAGNSFSNNQVLMPLATVQDLTDQENAVTNAVLTVDSIENVEAVTKAAQNTLGDSADVVNDVERAEEAVAPLENIQTISMYSLIGAVTAGAVIILMTMIMIVRERRREVGVLKAIGASNIKVMGQFASEAVTFTMLGAAVGIVLGVIAGNPITKMLVTNATNSGTQMGPAAGGPGMMIRSVGRGITDVTANVGWEVIVYGLLVALLIAVVGSALASFFIAKVRPAEVMRAD